MQDRRCLVLSCLALMLLGAAGCATPLIKPADRSPDFASITQRQEEGKYAMTEEELQSEVMSFADRLASIISQTAVVFENQLRSPEARVRAREMKVFTMAAAFEAAAGPNAAVALLDTVVMVTLNRTVWEEYWGPKVFGEPAEGVIEAWKKLESDIWSIADRVLTHDEQQELRRLIQEWRQNHPDQVAVNFVRFSDFGASRRKSPLASAQRPGGLLGVEEATAAIDQMRLLTERAMFHISRMQLVASLQFELALANFFAQPETIRALDTSARLLNSSERLSVVLEQLPVKFEEKLYPAIAEIDRVMLTHRQAAIDQFAERVAAERQALLRDLTSGEERLLNLIGDAREVLAIGKDLASQIDSTVTKVDTLAARFGPGSAEAGRTLFHIEDYRAAARELSATVENLKGLVVSIDQLLGSPAWDRRLPQVTETADWLESRVERGLNHSFLLGAALILVFFLALLAYRYASAKLVKSSQRIDPTR